MFQKQRMGIFLSGVVLAAVATAGAFFSDMPPWFGEAVYVSAAYIVVSLLVLAIVTHLVSKLLTGRLVSVFILSVVGAAVLVPNLYLNVAVFLGRAQAEFQTWHLLSLFTAMYQVIATALTALLVGGACIVAYLFKR